MSEGPNGHGAVDPQAAAQQAAMMAMVGPMPRPTAFRVDPEKMVHPDPEVEDQYFVHEVLHSNNGIFHFYWDMGGAKAKAAALRTAAAQCEQWKSGLWTPPQAQGPSGLIVPPGH